MDNSVYIMLSRQLGLFRDLDVTGNNLANVNTGGYNANRLLFTSYLENDAPRGRMAFAHDISTYRDTMQGAVQVTNNPLDVAISGEGYFMVRTPLGTRYTRAGHFQISSEGTLVTSQGYEVLDTGGQPIQFSPEDTEIEIGGAGNIKVNGEERATLGLVSFQNPQAMRRVGDTLLTTDEAPSPAAESSIAQGALEQSNVQPVMETTHLIDLSRSMASTAKFIETMYDLQRRNTTAWSGQS